MALPFARSVARFVDERAPIFEPLALIALASLASTRALEPFVAHALSQQGAPAQGAAQVALWLSGALAPVAAFGRALGIALVCWSCAVFLGERVSLWKLVSSCCVAETVFSLRDLGVVAVLLARGFGRVQAASDLMVAFGVRAFLTHPSALERVSFETWDVFSIVWALLIFWLLRSSLKLGRRPAASLAAMAFLIRTLFAAATLLYSL